jgi:RimJ/RimL family protein N-acetyltransferase
MILETDRLILRQIKMDDKEAVFEYRSDKETNKYQGSIPETLEEMENFIRKTAKQINEPDTWFQFVLLAKESNKVIGDIGLHFLADDDRQVEIGFTLHKAYQKKGYATEALKSILNYLFSELNKHRIIASIDPDNIDSIRLVERLGLRKEGHFVQSLFFKGEWADELIYAMLKREWR